MKAVRIETSPFQVLALVEFESVLKKNQHGFSNLQYTRKIKYSFLRLYIGRRKRSANGYDIGRNMGAYLVL